MSISGLVRIGLNAVYMKNSSKILSSEIKLCFPFIHLCFIVDLHLLVTV